MSPRPPAASRWPTGRRLSPALEPVESFEVVGFYLQLSRSRRCVLVLVEDVVAIEPQRWHPARSRLALRNGHHVKVDNPVEQIRETIMAKASTS